MEPSYAESAKILYNLGYEQLNETQKTILRECLERNFGILSLPMGSGKTILSLVMGLKYLSMTDDSHHSDMPIIIVAQKSLVGTWRDEIKNFFGDRLNFIILHQSYFPDLNGWEHDKALHAIITTKEVLGKIYKKYDIESRLISSYRRDSFGPLINHFKKPIRPILNIDLAQKSPDIARLYSHRWQVVIIDEAQKYSNIKTAGCLAITALCSHHKWLLSGTIISDPKPERVFGIMNMISSSMPRSDIPNNLPDFQSFMKSGRFQGLMHYSVYRAENVEFVPPKVHEEIAHHGLSKYEYQIYTDFQKILRKLYQSYIVAESGEARSSIDICILEIITYMRQIVVCPLIPLTSIYLKSFSIGQDISLTKDIMQGLNEINIADWMDKEESLISSRYLRILDLISCHKDDRIVIFSCFRSCLNGLKYVMLNGAKFGKEQIGRNIFDINAKHSIEERNNAISNFGKSKSGILMLTYDIGACGLNLQASNTVILMDFWWHAGKTQQAIARILRYGQKNKQVNIYFLSSGTGLESVLFEKQRDKLDICNDIMSGQIKKGKTETALSMAKVAQAIIESDFCPIIKDINFKYNK